MSKQSGGERKRPSKRAWVITGVAAGVVVAGVVTWVLWPSRSEPRPRAYKDATACLLTDQLGVSGLPAQPLWDGMQAASTHTSGQVRYLAVTGEQTAVNAESFVGTLILGKCAVIVAEPGIADDAVRALAPKQPAQRFLVVGGKASTANLSRVDGNRSYADTSAQVEKAVDSFLDS